jgi:PAS domain S-box-containing protein
VSRHLSENSNSPWLVVLDQLGEAIIVIDERRVVLHLNDAARRLLGYEDGQPIGGRCRHTTQGVDCEHSCPLTYALEAGLPRVESFAAIYRTASGEALPLDVTVVPLFDDDRVFRGAVEILRPSTPSWGFFLCGRSEAAAELRRTVLAVAKAGGDVVVVGEAPACRDVARAIHRFSGLPDSLFQPWRGSWDGISAWPPGAVFGDGPEAAPLIAGERLAGWRVLLGARSADGVPSGFDLVRLPPLQKLAADLPCMIAAWVDELAPGTRASSSALEQLATMAADRGLAPLEEVLVTAAAAAGDCIDTGHLPLDGARPMFVDELLRAEKPLAALEERVVREVVKMCGWRMQEAADRLGISRVTLWRKMKDLGIDRP